MWVMIRALPEDIYFILLSALCFCMKNLVLFYIQQTILEFFLALFYKRPADLSFFFELFCTRQLVLKFFNKRATCKKQRDEVIYSRREAKAGAAGGHVWHDVVI
jgi:hypothetical protein